MRCRCSAEHVCLSFSGTAAVSLSGLDWPLLSLMLELIALNQEFLKGYFREDTIKEKKRKSKKLKAAERLAGKIKCQEKKNSKMRVYAENLNVGMRSYRRKVTRKHCFWSKMYTIISQQVQKPPFKCKLDVSKGVKFL